MDQVRSGGCRCGKVRFEATGDPMVSMACHCKGCQRMTASAFSLSEGYPARNFRVTSGEVVIGGIHGPQAKHYFCDYCKSWLFTEMALVPDFVNVRATMFDEVLREVPFIETYTAEALPWALTGAPNSYEGLPAMEEWPGLMQAFAASLSDETSEERNA